MYSPAKPAPITTASRFFVSSAILLRLLELAARCRGCRGLAAAVLDDAGPDRLHHVLESAFTARKHKQREEPVHLSADALQVHGHAGRFQFISIRFALVAK